MSKILNLTLQGNDYVKQLKVFTINLVNMVSLKHKEITMKVQQMTKVDKWAILEVITARKKEQCSNQHLK